MTLPIAPGSYKIDPVHSQVCFAVKHLGISTISGRFDQFDGTLHVGDDLASTSVDVEAQVASVSTGFHFRDEQLLIPDLLDATAHPTMTFRSSSIAEAGSGYTMTSDLTINGITHPVSLGVTFNGSNTFPVDDSTHFGFTATGVVSRSSFGATAYAALMSDEVSVTIDAQFVRPKADD